MRNSFVPVIAFDAAERHEDLDRSGKASAAAEGESRVFWERVRARLRVELGEDVFASWFARMECDRCEGAVVEFSVPTRFLKSWIVAQYYDRLLSLCREERRETDRIEIAVRTAIIRVAASRAEAGAARPAPRPDSHQPANEIARKAAQAAPDGSPLDPRLTFDHYIVGRSNKLAHAAAQQVGLAKAGDPVLFNPLYLHAGVGLGKTHLLQALAAAAEQSGRRVLYLTAEKFMYGFVQALKSQTALAFKEAMRAIDVLVVDDLQFLQGKAVQQEFCHTLNALIDSGRQVVVAADRPPADLDALEDRVRSRLAGGLVVEIGALDEELRLKILQARIAAAKAQHQDFDVPADVVAYIAANVTQTGRDLEGACHRLLAHAKLTGQRVTLDMAERSLRDLIRVAEPKRIRIEDIQRVTARHYNVSRQDMLSSRRTASVVKPRQVAMYLSKTLTPRSLPEIGRRFGGRDHTTVLHAVRKIEGLLSDDQSLASDVDLLRRMLQEL